MSKALVNFLAVAFLSGSAGALGQTNSYPSFANTDAVNAFVQIQAQLHETQMLVESNREQTVAALEHSADSLAADIRLLEGDVADERAHEADAAWHTEETLLVAGGIVMLVLAAVVVMVFLQLRAVTRLIELALASPGPGADGGGVLPMVETAAALPPSARAALEFSNARLLGVIERLEKRILELEQTVRAPLNEPENHSTPMAGQSDADHRISDLIMEGQLFLDTNKPEKALATFEKALEIEPQFGDALIKKAAALEKLGRTDEAIACYNQAIEADEFATTALLQKGGLLNRLARYEEALQCYEHALRTQEKKA
jgi:tetratricopeptide (TPR) repeat protein